MVPPKASTTNLSGTIVLPLKTCAGTLILTISPFTVGVTEPIAITTVISPFTPVAVIVAASQVTVAPIASKIALSGTNNSPLSRIGA